MHKIIQIINEKLEIETDDLMDHEEIQGILSDIGINNIKMISSGNNGTAYDAGDVVIKVTGDLMEYANAIKLQGQSNTGAVDFYSAYKLSDDYSNLASGSRYYLIVMEKITPAKGMIEKIGNIIGENLTYPFTTNEKARLKSLVFRKEPAIKRHRQMLHKLEEILDAIESLNDLGIRLQDFHGENLGLDSNNNIKIYDLGSK